MTDDGYVDRAQLQEVSARLLTDALTSVLKRLGEVNSFIDAHAASFADYHADCEHRFEWADIHYEYCAMVEDALQMELLVLGCTEDALFEHAARAVDDPVADELLTRLCSKTDYLRFVEMMHEEHCALPARYDDDDDDAYEYVEVEEDGEEGAAAPGEADEEEGLLEALLEQSIAGLRIADR